uniref:Uncharacterized protein n=1 Tax=Acrobeloides nanus TaxID=290746 RepID=A0A914CDY0_9BILA
MVDLFRDQLPNNRRTLALCLVFDMTYIGSLVFLILSHFYPENTSYHEWYKGFSWLAFGLSQYRLILLSIIMVGEEVIVLMTLIIDFLDYLLNMDEETEEEENGYEADSDEADSDEADGDEVDGLIKLLWKSRRAEIQRSVMKIPVSK